ncbi:multiple antibiotic resistance protein [Amaricoccus macauensis]|uniref:UPF0056 membrane protein n=1 Tax=Amaricoccus macauensis TaxID=57001 RepID=A0A840SR24_9RHOB|nr:MarC family protein [Amaricoccus macauensis]MBB5222306.1 multiple antibiotic resistance protein [Amaricoccus macauensis]
MTEVLVTAFVTLFVIIDPIGLAPIFIALTRGMTRRQRHHVGARALLIGFVILAVFGLFGEGLLGAIGISIPAFRISGGILLFLTALDMLFERRTDRRERQSEENLGDPSVFPLAMPLIAGPGAMTTIILLGTRHSDSTVTMIGIGAVLIAVLVLTYVLFRLSHLIEHALGHTGISVLTRLFGILLAALSVQFVLDGLREYGFLST